jgi:hypothetical protein
MNADDTWPDDVETALSTLPPGHAFTTPEVLFAKITDESREDWAVTVTSYDDGVTLEQLDPETDSVQVIHLSLQQVRELAAALDLPEGVYRMAQEDEAG